LKAETIKSYRVKMMMYTMLCMVITFICDLIAIYIYKYVRGLIHTAAKDMAETNFISTEALPKTYINNQNLSNAISASPIKGLDLPFILILVCLSLFLFVMLFHLFTRQRVNYLTQITDAIQQISDGHFDTRLDVIGDDEFAVISDNINRMAIDLEFLKKKGDKEEKQRNELITNVAHDLRTPLTSIIGYLDIVNTHPELSEAQKKKYIHIAYTKSVRLQEMIEDLFSFTKLSCNKMPIKKSTLDIVKLLQQEIDEFYPSFSDNDLKCEFNTDNTSYMICADGMLIARAFENLIGNAIKYGRTGKIIKIDISGSENKVKVAITNYGNVIPESDIPFIFDQFYRVDTSRNEETGGTGLGLSITKAIIEEHQGSISAKSSLSGTVFEVILDTTNKED